MSLWIRCSNGKVLRGNEGKKDDGLLIQFCLTVVIFHAAFDEHRWYPEKFFQYYWMSETTFYELLELLSSLYIEAFTVMKTSINPSAERIWIFIEINNIIQWKFSPYFINKFLCVKHDCTTLTTLVQDPPRHTFVCVAYWSSVCLAIANSTRGGWTIRTRDV